MEFWVLFLGFLIEKNKENKLNSFKGVGTDKLMELIDELFKEESC